MPTATDRLKRWLLGLAVVVAGIPAAPVAAQTLTSSCYVAYPANTTSRLCTALDTLVASDLAKAPLASPTFTGTPAAPTAAPGTNTTQLATTAFVTGALVGYQPADGDLTSLSAAAGTNTIYYRSAANTWTPVAIGSGLSFSGGSLASTGGTGTVTSVGLTSTDLAVSGSPVTGSGVITANLTTTGVTAGSYGSTSVIPGYTVDNRGRLSLVTTYTVTPASIGAQAAGTYATGTGSASGTNTGDETAATIRTKLGITTLSGSNTGDQPFTASGDATAPSSTNNLALTLATVNANVGSFGTTTQAPVITFDAKGRAVAASQVTITPAFASLTGIPTTLSGYGITDALSSTTVRSANTVLAGPTTGASTAPTWRALVAADIPALPYQAAGSYLTSASISGDVTAPSTGTGALTATLATVNANTGSFGSSSAVPVITANAKGLITGVTTATITPAAIGAPSGSGTSTGANTGDQAAVLYTTQTLTAGQQLIGRTNIAAQFSMVNAGSGSDATSTFAPGTNGTTYFFSTALTAARILNLSANNTYDGLTVRIVFTSTGGFTLQVRDATTTANSKTLSVNNWVDFTWSATAGAWRESAYGSL